MTFEELFIEALGNITATEASSSGRHSAEDLFIDELKPLINKVIEHSNWQSGWISQSYTKDDPYIFLSAHGVSEEISFKVRLKKTGTKYSWYSGNSTYYKPVAAHTSNEDLMKQDVLEYLNQLYSGSEKIAKQIERNKCDRRTYEEYKDVIDRYNNIAKEIDSLPKDAKEAIRRVAKLNYINWY